MSAIISANRILAFSNPPLLLPLRRSQGLSRERFLSAGGTDGSMAAMKASLFSPALVFLVLPMAAADFNPAPQRFRQESAAQLDSLAGSVQLIQSLSGETVRIFINGGWQDFRDRHWQTVSELTPRSSNEFVFADSDGQAVTVSIPWRQVKQVLCLGKTNYIATSTETFMLVDSRLSPIQWSSPIQVNQIAVSPEGTLWLASNDGLFRQNNQAWETVTVLDGGGRAWAVRDVLGVAFDSTSSLWFATKAGIGCRTAEAWRFYEGKDGLPWNDFTCLAADNEGGVWFGTHLGAIHFDRKEWQYRQGPRWLPNDDVKAIAINQKGTWFATAQGVGLIARVPMTLAEKAEFYEREIEQFVKRTSLGYVAEAYLRSPGVKSSADPQDSDNDGLWTAMYGAGECFSYAASKDPKAKQRARQAFEALRFLQKVTEGGEHSPPKGYIARTIRPASWPNPNVGRLEGDEQARERDRLWKVYEPRWPKSADNQWFWKSDTSSDELDGHFFFYPLYFELCADTDAEKQRVQDVVRGIADHLLTHQYVLIDHDGKPTRWAVYGPQFLNRDPIWWPERGLNSLSILSYLAVAAYVTGDPKYSAASRELIDEFGYAHNAMYPKVQQGPGSGNQSDDEMAFMCYYSLLRYSKDETLKGMIRYSFFRYWANEAAEMNPFFNFAYAAHNLRATTANAWGSVHLEPWPGWHEDSMRTLYGFPLDRLNWPLKNSHRLDITPLPRVRASDLDSPDHPTRGSRINGKVLPIENRHFTHWNTDPWQLDYGGNGNELAAGTVFLIPYYMGMYHGFIEPSQP